MLLKANLLLLIFLNFCFGDPFGRENGAKIVGGINAVIEDIPWQVAIHFYRVNHCGGSIINDHTILTAAHCFYKTGADPADYSVRAGTDIRSVNGKMFTVKDIIVHPKFDITTYNNDIAIMKLDNSIEFDNKMQPIPLASINDELPVGEYGLVSGFGKLGTNLLFPKYLQMVNLEILNQKVCEDLYSNVNIIQDNMFCAGGDGTKDACSGDSGGPFVFNGKLYGITSYGIQCALPEYPGVFTKVSALRPWIDDNTI